jgi:hypothetical protein
VAGEFDDALVARDCAPHDVTPRVIRQCTEHTIEVGWGDRHQYNHMVVLATYHARALLDRDTLEMPTR